MVLNGCVYISSQLFAGSVVGSRSHIKLVAFINPVFLRAGTLDVRKTAPIFPHHSLMLSSYNKL
jgi:hypothetical protein